MALTTEALIKRTLTRLYKLVIQWYKEHPEGRRDPKQEIDCYGSATLTLETDYQQYHYIESALNGTYIEETKNE